MTVKEDVLRALEYGKDPYYMTIQAVPSYQNELNRVNTDFKGKSWLEWPFALPKFTTSEFEAKRIQYQAKYGNELRVPGYEDIFHLGLRVTITPEQMAAHKWASARKLPSPLNPDQLQLLTKKRSAYLRMLASPAPTWKRGAAAILTAMDNAEDALVTATVLGRLALKLAPRLMGRMVPALGWTLLGSDILNLLNMMGVIGMASGGKKRSVEALIEKNPFHKKAWANRANKLKRVWPTFGEALEIAQTTDQMFGFGLCLGGIMGMAQDAVQEGTEQIAKGWANLVETAKHPENWQRIWADAIDSATLIWTGSPDIVPYEVEKVTAAANHALKNIIPWWYDNYFMDKTAGFREMKKILKPPKDPSTVWNLEALGVDPLAPLMWPIIDKTNPTLEEITYTYSPIIKNNFQTYLLNHSKDYQAMLTGAQAVEYHQHIVAALSDDRVARVSQTSYSQSAKEMARDILLIPPSAPQAAIDQLSAWIGQYERTTGGSPTTKEIEVYGRMVGIRWDRVGERVNYGKAAELFPEWKAIQDQLKELYIAD